MTAAPAYPQAERLDLVDHLHGRRRRRSLPLAGGSGRPAHPEWSAAQDALARGHLDALPGRERLAATLGALTAAGWLGVPAWRAGRRFATRREPGQEHGVLYVTDPVGTDLAGAERVLIDPAALDPTGTTTLDAWTPDHAGRLLAYQLSSGGDEQSVLHVLDVTTGEDVEPPIDRCRYSDVAWLPGGEEFLYVRMVAPDEAPPGEQAFHRRIWRHRVGTPTDADVLIDGPGLYEQHTYYGVDVSDDGRWLLVTANVGTARRDSVWIADLQAASDGAPWSRCSRRPTTCAAIRGWSATAGSTCSRPTALPASASPSPTRPRRGASTGANWWPRTPTRCSTASRGCSPPARTTRPTDCSRSPAAVTPPRRWRCTTATGRCAAPSRCPGSARCAA